MSRGKTAVPSSDLPMKHGYYVHKNRMCEDKRHAVLLAEELAPPPKLLPQVKYRRGKIKIYLSIE